MKLKKIEKIHEGRFLSYYIGYYLNNQEEIYKYEFISRNNHLTLDTFKPIKSAGVGLVTYNEDKTKVLLQKEFRLACNNWVYNFPAGLIDEGETVYEAAKRELKEETGTDLLEIEALLPPSYASQGTSDEMMEIIVCRATGSISESCYVNEEIVAGWYTKEDVKKLFDAKEYMSVRTQMFLYQWINSDK